MKLSNKEKIILAVFLAIVILFAGFFLLIKPEYDKISTNKSTLQDAKSRKEALLAVLARESTIDQEIQTAFDKANKFSPYFYDDLTVLDADELTRKILRETGMSTKGLSIGDFTTSTLTVSDYIETVITYPLKEYSGYVPDTGIDFSNYQITYDEEGNIVVPEELKTAMKDFLNTMLTTQSQTIGSISVSLNIEGTKGDLLKFLDYIAGLEKATYIPGVEINYTDLGAGQQPETPGEDQGNGGEEEQPPVQPAANVQTAVNDDTKISTGITIVYYCVKPLQAEVSTDAGAAPEVTEAA
ncbi:MAG TPA: hypothetical protein DDX91_03685 [Ruminococcaceae bacterium]|nr:hypothetical protein [Oscillospiraceae bacterium]